jgi:TIR domain-containing protein
MGESKPFAFVSYSHEDDQALGGAITKFREGLAEAVGTYSGEDELQLFQDSAALGWGEPWKQRIQREIEQVTFFIPILTPKFFNRKECREELSLFLRREQELGRNDLVLPVYFVDCDLLETADQSSDELAAAIAERQRVDWRELRKSLPEGSRRFSKKIRMEFDNLAKEVVQARRRAESDRRSAEDTTLEGDTGTQEASSAGAMENEDVVQSDEAAPAPLMEQVVASGALDAGASEFYTALLAADQTYQIFVAPDDSTVDFDLRVYDQDDNLVAEDVDARSDAYCEVTPAQTGSFRLLVECARGTSTYTILVAPKSADEGPGESPPDDQVLVYPSFLPSEGTEVVDIQLEAGHDYVVYVRPDDPSVDFDLGVFDENDNLIAEDTDVTSYATCLVSPSRTGPFRLAVTSARGASDYRLFVLVQ